MWRVLFRLRLFFLLFETAGMPSLATLMRSALTLGLWLGLSTLTALPVQTVFCLVVLFWFAAGHLLHWRTTIEKMNRRKNRLTPRAFAVVFILTIGLALLAPDPSWVQHLVTFTIAMHAFACLSDMFDKEATFGHFWWPGKEIDHVRPTLTLVFFPQACRLRATERDDDRGAAGRGVARLARHASDHRPFRHLSCDHDRAS